MCFASLEVSHRTVLGADYEFDRDRVTSIDLPTAKSIAGGLHNAVKGVRPKLVLETAPNGAPLLSVEFAIPPLSISDDNYLGYWMQHWVVSLACQSALEEFCRANRLDGRGLGIANFAPIRDGLSNLFLQDRQLFEMDIAPNLQEGLGSFTMQNLDEFHRSVLVICQAQRREFAGYRSPNPRAPVGVAMDAGGLETQMHAVEERILPVRTAVAQNGIIEFVSELEHRINVHQRKDQSEWNWNTVPRNNLATLVPGSLYYFRLERNPAKCYTIAVTNGGVNLPNR